MNIQEVIYVSSMAIIFRIKSICLWNVPLEE